MMILAGKSPIVSQTTSVAPVSPAIKKLQADIAAGRSSAQAEFWDLVTRRGSPLIEEIPGDRERVLATFLWRHDGNTKRVTLDARVDGDDPFDDALKSMNRIDGLASTVHQLSVFDEGLSNTAVGLRSEERLGGLSLFRRLRFR